MREAHDGYRADWYHNPVTPDSTPPEKAGHPKYWYATPEAIGDAPPVDAAPPTPHQPPYRVPGTSPRYGEEAEWERPLRRRRQTRRNVVLVVCALVLVAAAAVAVLGLGTTWREGVSGEIVVENTDRPSYDWNNGDDEEVYDSYQDFFEDYYNSGTVSGTNDLPKATTGTGVTLELVQAGGGELTYQEIYARCAPSIVAITTTGSSGSYWGTGIIFTSDGYIVTNNHLIDGTSEAVVTLDSGEEYDALLVGFDAASDLAVLKIQATGLPAAEFASSDTLTVGDTVVAIGNPLGEELRGTMTDGIVSAINRDITYEGNTMTLIQTNAAINEGNSGGALINMQGQVIGLTNMKMMSYYSSIEGIGFAIPTVTMKEVVDELIAWGYVTGRPVLGVTVGAIPSDAELLYDLPDGVYVSAVQEGSDAYKKGVQAGDIITEVNGQTVTTTDEINAIKETMSVGDVLLLTIYRDGETFVVDVELVDQQALQQ